ncbi:endospore germination permease [Paenibacillus sp. CGMCC 1.16610]|uniref:Endospore germination permease n=1 Tax=Paenibacillus anseongense TaxID=2682845 RepID=A0ABW9U8P8_9BACL|nr:MULTISPECIES: endospore germination permease [Paenibacillus]MBA2937401.1 endospore germination permease [Paenibacillus sp. CGMCC 1.16610]MVQ36459.1 endospore germination permease [Paenibacillus anseongense]
MENARLSGWQMFTVTYSLVIGTTYILLPGKLMVDAKQYAWLIVVWSTLYGLLLAGVWLYLAKHYPGKGIIEIANEVLGKWAGGVVSILYILFFIQMASWVTRNLGDFMHSTLMPRTPIPMFVILTLFACAYAVVKGIETIAIVCELITPYMVLAFWLPFSFMLREWDWTYFKVPFDFQFMPMMIKTNYVFAFPYMETVALMMLFPFVGQRLKTSYLLGIGIGGCILTLCMFFTIGILGTSRGSALVYPIFTIFREMQFSRFIEHLEAVISINILLLVCLKLSILFYCAVLGICQLFKVEKRAAVAYPLVWFMSGYSLLFANILENIVWIQKYLFPYYMLFAIIIPLLLIFLTWIRNKPKLLRTQSPA